MIELYYDSYSVAYFVVSQEMGTKTQMEFLDKLYEQEYEFLHPIYKGNKKDFISDVLYWTDYLVDKEKLDKEYPVVEKDFKATGRQFIRENMMSDYPEFDLFFMLLRLRILYLDGKDYVRMKLRTLLKHYGYKRRSDAITSHIKDCMMFYHIQPYLRGEEECDIRKIDLDDMITFRVL
ncbi:MAG: hypothetical protein J6I76_17765 [Oribacterium sp.]|nr:hypothetical protein [Oribacterium sp.]